MQVPAYLYDKKNRIGLKCHAMKADFSPSYHRICDNLVSRFHGWKKQNISNIDQSTLDFIAKYDFPLDETEQKEKLNESGKNSFISDDKTEKNSHKDRLDWTRGRISGEIISIVVKDGKIVEKVYMTTKGNRITVRRRDLGLLTSLSSF